MSNQKLKLGNTNSSLSLEDIAPKWAERLRQMPILSLSLRGISLALKLTDAERCVVGEAHGFSDCYLKNCEKCEIIGSNFQTSFITRSFVKLQKNIESFVKHWNEEHAEFTLKKKQKITLLTTLT